VSQSSLVSDINTILSFIQMMKKVPWRRLIIMAWLNFWYLWFCTPTHVDLQCMYVWIRLWAGYGNAYR